MTTRQAANTLQAAIAALQNPSAEEIVLRVMAGMQPADCLQLTSQMLNAPYTRYLDDEAADNVSDAMALVEAAQLVTDHYDRDPRDERKLCVVDQAGSGMGGWR